MSELRILLGALRRAWHDHFLYSEARRIFASEVTQWKNLGGVVDSLYPVLDDATGDSGLASGHYFHQDLLVAQSIFSRAPDRHLDIGSSIYGFCSHVASFRRIEVLDIRTTPVSAHANLKFVQGNLYDPDNGLSGKTYDSVSCLHTLEHFGLGRYGDQINPEAHLLGFQKLVELVSPGGYLYLSFLIGIPSAVQFNAHRIFDPTEILGWPRCGDLSLERFDWVDDEGALHREAKPEDLGPPLANGLGIYTLKKLTSV